MMRRIILLVTVAAMMAMSAVPAFASQGTPPAGDGYSGCLGGQTNAYRAIGTGYPSGEDQAPYSNHPGQGVGPHAQGFPTSEGNTEGGPRCP